MAWVEVYGGQRSLAFELTTAITRLAITILIEIPWLPTTVFVFLEIRSTTHLSVLNLKRQLKSL